MIDDAQHEFAKELEDHLTARYGPILGPRSLPLVLGYPSVDAFRRSVTRKTIPVPLFRIPNRRGHYALTAEVARWLATYKQMPAKAQT